MLLEPTHPQAAFWLDIADKVIKASAVLLGGIWTWINYRRSRTYAKKLDLQLSGNVFEKQDLYIEINVGLKNLGAGRHPLQQEGTSCELIAIMTDLSEQPIGLFSIFKLDEWIEPGESISDSILHKIQIPADEIVWVRIELRVIWKGLEWNSSCLVRV